jgi:transglutaminase-like putative cysteine protease
MMTRALIFLLSAAMFAQDDFTADAIRRAGDLEGTGKFREAAGVLREALQKSTGSKSKTLEFELDRLRRIRLDYSLTMEALRGQLREGVNELTGEEFDRWIALGWFDGRVIDDTLRFVGTSKSNLFLRHQDLEPRRRPVEKDAELEAHTWRVADSISREAARSNTPYVLPKRFRMTMKLAVDADAVPEGATVRAWLPVPRHYPFQMGFTIVHSSSPVKSMAAEVSPIRSAYMEQKAARGKKTVFTLQYDYVMHGVRFNLDPASVRPLATGDSSVIRYLAEGPHVVFTEKIKQLSDSIAGGEKNILRKAKRIFDWMSENVLYSYAREYSTIRNISDYCLTGRYGDCGQHALLFITLCRYNGIPARWQSGWYTFPGAKTIHDWTEIYIKPYGWIPVDPDMGIWAWRYYTSLTTDQRRALRDFYFGGMEQYRMAANSDHSQTLEPPKSTLRSDTVDFQRGEVEWEGGNIYFDAYSSSMKVEELPDGM